jgi:hypothetical protein
MERKSFSSVRPLQATAVIAIATGFPEDQGTGKPKK